MYYLLIDSNGSSLDTFVNRDEALGAWNEVIASDESARGELAVLECDEDGTAVTRVDEGLLPAGFTVVRPPSRAGTIEETLRRGLPGQPR